MRIDRNRIRNVTVGGLAILLLTLGSSQAMAAFVEYNTQASWQAALAGGFLTEDFNDGTLNTGVSFVFNGQNHGIGIGGGIFNDIVTPNGTNGCTVGGSPSGCSTVWTFAAPIYAWGGTWDLPNPGGAGTGINVYANGVGVGINPSITNTTVAFWGFVSTTPFTTVALFPDGENGIQETYELENMVYAPVPEPATLLLLGSGLVGLASRRRRSN